jgi:hypothetical protein
MSSILLPFFIMHYCTYVIIGPRGDVERLISATMAPFDESLEVERYKVYLDKNDIACMAKFYKLSENDLSALIEKMPDWRGAEGGVDEGGLFSWLSANPEGKLDWFDIGGRWNGRFHGRNVIKTDTLLRANNLKKSLPFNIVTPDGAWYEREILVYCGDLKHEIVRKSDGRWLAELKRALLRYPNHRVVCVDIHS